jgi:hypothetical protein
MNLLAVISQHGLGHLAQAAPVLNALRRLEPALHLTIWSGLTSAALHAPYRRRLRPSPGRRRRRPDHA